MKWPILKAKVFRCRKSASLLALCIVQRLDGLKDEAVDVQAHSKTNYARKR